MKYKINFFRIAWFLRRMEIANRAGQKCRLSGIPSLAEVCPYLPLWAPGELRHIRSPPRVSHELPMCVLPPSRTRCPHPHLG